MYINSIEEGTHRDEDGFVTSHTFIVISIRIEWLFYKRRLECADLGTFFFFFFKYKGTYLYGRGYAPFSNGHVHVFGFAEEFLKAIGNGFH